MTRRSLDDITARADEFADAFENDDPKSGDQDAPLPPTMAVKLAAWRRDAAEKELAEAVRAARADPRDHRTRLLLGVPPVSPANWGAILTTGA